MKMINKSKVVFSCIFMPGLAGDLNSLIAAGIWNLQLALAIGL